MVKSGAAAAVAGEKNSEGAAAAVESIESKTKAIMGLRSMMNCNDAIENPGESEGAAKAATEKESSLSRHSLLTAREKEEAIELAMGKSKPEKVMEVSLSSKEALQKFREEGCVHKMKEKQRRPGPAWSHVALNAGALGRQTVRSELDSRT